MNSKWHLITSLIKSAMMAEALGILEEVGDKR